ncbi:outer membrane beta-barrel protein [Hymenobacter rubripertinctus]|uniref:Uncharacterized protein n=1 Tax=Hymenobacter rubripertinctus TaxID=2029981 RepID=A0A418QXU9_9BACT|nr:outer membrane beta-barrel protein [Hymenobacter rubripertinctus]RIY09982.1 hypothetical protein D0T11_10560 [Hymenobacter rubripertinctus]
MRKTYFLLPLAAVLASFTAQAQTTQGTRVLGLSGGNFTFQRNDFALNYGGSVAPSAGLFVADNLALGAAVPLGYSRFKPNIANAITEQNLSLGLLPWLRYYIPSGSRHRVFGELSAGGVLNSYRRRPPLSSSQRTQSSTVANFHASAGLGYSYFITPAVGLEGLLAYQIINGNNDSNPFSGGALNFNLGFRVYLPKS